MRPQPAARDTIAKRASHASGRLPITRNNGATARQDMAPPQLGFRIPIQRRVAVAQSGHLQLGETLPALSAAVEDRHLVADQHAATVGEDRRQADQACSALLVAPGREPSRAMAVWEHGTADRRAGDGAGVNRGNRCNEIRRPGGRAGEVHVKCTEKTGLPGRGLAGGDTIALLRGRRWPMKKKLHLTVRRCTTG